MNSAIRKFLMLPAVLVIFSCSAPGHNDNTVVTLKTTLGDIKISLYDATPVHRDNFIKLARSGIYDNVLFHRVIKNFMIQTGDPSTRPPGSSNLPDTLKTYTIPPEFNSSLIHKRGAVAAARRGDEENPEMRSSGTQFYIVQGSRLTDAELDQTEQRISNNIKRLVFNKIMLRTADSLRSAGTNPSDSEVQDIASIKMFDYLSGAQPFKYTEEQRNIYRTEGGVPRLDGTYTVFGEVIEGMDIVDKIASAATDSNDRPVSDVRILRVKISDN